MSSSLEALLRQPPLERSIFANRTLNLRSIRAVGFDMDYTLVHYHVEVWEQKAYERALGNLLARGWPIGHLKFDPSFVILGLVLDLEFGNLLKASRFGYVSRAYHGTALLDFDRQRDLYSRTLVDLREPRWVFLNTLFSLSEAMLYMQCVDLLDQGQLGPGIGYADLYDIVRAAIDETHTEGDLKAEIARNPAPFVEQDPDVALTLLDLKRADKKLLLVTNSEWSYTQAMMSFALDPHLPNGQTWRDVFDLVVVSARKPDFFSGKSPIFEVIDDSGLLKPTSTLKAGAAYLGGNARILEQHLGMRPEEILYVGDHLYSDVHVTKDLLRWRTALVIRDIERDVVALESFRPKQAELTQLMQEKERLEHRHSALRLLLQRRELAYGPESPAGEDELREELQRSRARLTELDQRIAPLASESGQLANARWGLMMRSGIDKSYLARQVERYADVYTSRVSNFSSHGPAHYLRAPRVSLPHDPDATGGG